MRIAGLQKTTLLDYPGKVACTVFLAGCNLRCPFCHNSDLLEFGAEPAFTEEEVLKFLAKRKGILEGVAITGGEPTLQPDLRDFILRVREMGYLVKLDTNYVAMDIKTCKGRYPEVAGIPSVNIGAIMESVDFLKKGTVPYEFRTTVVKELHSIEDFEMIGPWISGCPNYYLQNFVDSDNVMYQGFSSCTKDELLAFRDAVKPFVGNVELRGVDY